MRTIISKYFEDALFGFGDFLRGSLALKQESELRGLDFGLDFSEHEIGNYIKSKKTGNTHGISAKADFYMKFNRLQDFLDKKEIDTFNICSNSYHGDSCGLSVNESQEIFQKHLEQQTISWFRENIYFSDEIVNQFNNRLSKNNIENYELIHFRIGDDHSFIKGEKGVLQHPRTRGKPPILKEGFWPSFLKIILEKNKNNNNKILIICDSPKFKSEVKQSILKAKAQNIFVLSGDAGHTSLAMLDKRFRNPDKRNLFETFFDLYTITKAKKITSYCTYDFVSNFIRWPSIIFNVKVDLFNFDDIVSIINKYESKK